MKNCPACGAPNRDDASFCSACGARFADAANAAGPSPDAGPQPDQPPRPGSQYSGGYGAYPPPIAPHSVAVCIILCIVTCGIYMLYWMYRLNEELNHMAGEQNGTSGALVLVFTILTCGIYGIYWNYKMGQNVSRLTGDTFSPILMLILALFQFGIISMALMQDTINKCL